jgi:glyoxylase-like metal-dependent hydrolase (beta-lactamase superfamily II)
MEIFKKIFSPIQVNTYILADKSGDCALLDCGCYDENEFSQLVKLIDSKMLNPVLLLNTHCHLDHIFGNKFILDKYKLKSFCSEDDEMNRKNAVGHASYFGLSMESPPEPAGYISDGQTISFGSTKLLTLHVPGHTTGSIAFYSESDGCVFTGDALFAGSIGRTDLQGGDYKTLINSIKNKLLVLPPSTVVLSGHGPETTIEKEMKTNPYLT